MDKQTLKKFFLNERITQIWVALRKNANAQAVSLSPARWGGERKRQELVPEWVVLREGLCARELLQVLVSGEVPDPAAVRPHLQLCRQCVLKPSFPQGNLKRIKRNFKLVQNNLHTSPYP